MNKKILGIVVGALIIVVVGSLMVMKSKGITPVKGIEGLIKPSISLESPAKFLPSDTVMFYSLSDLKGIWSDISKSKFWADFSNLKVWADFNIKENIKKIQGTLEERIKLEVTESRIMDLLGSRVTVGVAIDHNSKDVKVYLQSYVGKTIQFIEKSLNESTGTEAKKSEYNGETILLFPAPQGNGPEIRYALVNNILTVVFGKGETDIQHIIDLIKGKGDSLYTEANYSQMLKNYGGDNDCISLYYSDFSKIYGILPDLIKPLMDASPEQFAGFNMQEMTKNLEQLLMIGGKAVRTNDGVKMLSYLVPNMSKLTAEEKEAWNSKPQKLESISFVPSDAILYSTTGMIDAPKLWKTFNETANQPAPQSPNATAPAALPLAGVLSALKDFEKNYNISLEKDVIGQIGNEASFVFGGINLDSAIPVPRISLLIKSSNAQGLKDKLKGVLEKLLSSGTSPIPVTIESKAVEGTDFVTMKTQFGEGFSPVMGATGSWLVISSNAVTAEKLLKSSKGESPLESSDAFKKINSGNGLANQLTFVNMKSGMTLVSDLMNWLLQKKDMIPQAEQYKEIAASIATYAVPLLESLKVLDTLGFSSSKEGDMTVQEVTLNISDLK